MVELPRNFPPKGGFGNFASGMGLMIEIRGGKCPFAGKIQGLPAMPDCC